MSILLNPNVSIIHHYDSRFESEFRSGELVTPVISSVRRSEYPGPTYRVPVQVSSLLIDREVPSRYLGIPSYE